MQEDILRQHTLEQALKIAIAQHQFVVHYQPILRLYPSIGRFEALVRWHPQRGLLFPGEFMDVVENRGMSRALTPGDGNCVASDRSVGAARVLNGSSASILRRPMCGIVSW